MGISAALQQQARARARERRIALEHSRFERDRRVEAAAAVAIVALGERAAAMGQVMAAEERVGRALAAIMAEGVTAGGAAQLCDLTAGEARRLRQSARGTQDCPASATVAGPDPGRPPTAALRGSDDWQGRRPAAGRVFAPLGRPGDTARPQGRADGL